MSVTEAEIIEGCRAGKSKLQKALYERYSGKMYNICLRYAKNSDEAEDILQEGFIKVFDKINQFAGTGSFEGWIRRIMVNSALEVIRKRKIDFSVVDTKYIQDPHEYTYNTISTLNVKELLAVIQQLPDGYRTVFNLYVIEGYQHSEIAEILGVSEGTSKSQLARARNLLQSKLNETEQNLRKIK
ncbi:MAG TPA: RNA polymerase sigma factor [Bacteroidia bacterium]|nr:RNA polymerase sigma factor [Bacteroidia bacterium]